MASRAGDLSWTRFPIARLRYTQSKKIWTLYWRDRNLKFHLYEAAAPTQTIDELLDEIDTDPTAMKCPSAWWSARLTAWCSLNESVRGGWVSSSVTATFVFTDLVDSTATAARLGPEAAEELRQTHFRLLRGAVAASGGTEVKNLGDGLMVMFSSPSRALAGAVGMQQAIEHHNRSGR